MDKLSYEEARKTSGTPLSTLITDKLLSGEGIGKSFSSSIGEKLSAKRTRMKETFDPLNMIKFLTGGSNLGPALLGRMLGRNVDDITYFTNFDKVASGSKGSSYKKHQQRTNLEPFYTKLGIGTPLLLKNGDSVSDIVTKIYRLMKSIYDREEKLTKKEIKGLSAAAGSSVFSKSAKDVQMEETGDSILPAILAALAGGAGLGEVLSDISGDDLDTAGVSQVARRLGKGIKPKEDNIGKKLSTSPKKSTVKGTKQRQKSSATKLTIAERAKKFKNEELLSKSGKPLTGAALKSRVEKLEKTKVKVSKISKTYDRFKKALDALKSIESQVPSTVKSAISKFLGGASAGLRVWPFASAAVDLEKALEKYNSDKDDAALKKTGSEILGGLIGSFAGANMTGAFGSLVGRMIGMVVPIPGASMAGAAIGDIIGAYVGGKYGEKGGEAIGNWLYDNPQVLDNIDVPRIEIPQEVIDTASKMTQNVQDLGTAGSMWGDYISEDVGDIRTALNTGMSSVGQLLERMQNDYTTTQDQLEEFRNGDNASLTRNNNNVISSSNTVDPIPPPPTVRNNNPVISRTTAQNDRALIRH